MKKAIVTALLVVSAIQLNAQVTEGRSGVQQFSISKQAAATTPSDAHRAPTDLVAPEIRIESPVLDADSVFRTGQKTLLVKGRVKDEGGIFEVYVNGVEAKVSADGLFLAEVPQAIGRNEIRITALDVAMNRTDMRFYSERGASLVPGDKVQKASAPARVRTINFLNPAEDLVITASDRLDLKAVVTASDPMMKLTIHQNGRFVDGIPGSREDDGGVYRQVLNKTLTLKLGNNEIRVDAFLKDDTLSRTVNVEYSLYAARNFAVLIANEKYDDPKITDLSEPVKDAKELYSTLTKLYNFDHENVTLLTNSTKAEIIGTLHQLRSKVTPEDNLLIFYAGHGYWDEGMGVGYWLPRDAASENPADWIPNTDLTNYLGAIRTKHTLLVADACFSGGIFKTRSAFSESYAIEMLYQMNSRKAITSGTLTEVPDKSAFFYYFNKGLTENTLPYLAAEELFSKMRIAVINNSENVPQFGTIQNVGDEGGDFIFIRRK
jgi:hypothetical protein